MDIILIIWGDDLRHPFVDCFLVLLHPFNLPGKGGPTSSYTSASIAVKVIGACRLTHLIKVTISREERNHMEKTVEKLKEN
jgi:hypothetical protein